MTLQDVSIAVILIVVLILVGKLARNWIDVLQRLYLPSSLLGGMVALLLGPQALGWVVRSVWGEGAALATDSGRNGYWTFGRKCRGC
jgi:glutamate:Na+ symporter, ESS family